MKKFITSILAAATVLAMTCTAFAAPSPAKVGTVSTAAEATDANGNAVTPKIEEVAATVATPTTSVMKAAAKSEESKAIVTSKNAVVAAKVEISLPEGTVFPATITIKVDGIKATTKLVVLHEVNGAWQEEEATCGEGTVTIKNLNSCSPFVFVADKTTMEEKVVTDNVLASPKTGETSAIYAAVLVALVAMAGVVCVSRRRRA